MLGQAIEKLNQAGYQYIGIDHFAKVDDSLAVAQRTGALHRNFQGYTTHGDCDLLGLVCRLLAKLASIFANDTDLTAYKACIDDDKLPAVKHIHATLTDELRRYVIMNLLCHDYIDFKDVNIRFGIDPTTYFADEISQLHNMQADKLVDIDAKGIRVLPKGRLLGRNVAMVFDEYLMKNINIGLVKWFSPNHLV